HSAISSSNGPSPGAAPSKRYARRSRSGTSNLSSSNVAVFLCISAGIAPDQEKRCTAGLVQTPNRPRNSISGKKESTNSRLYPLGEGGPRIHTGAVTRDQLGGLKIPSLQPLAAERIFKHIEAAIPAEMPCDVRRHPN